jgi:signal transduction histidine kinase
MRMIQRIPIHTLPVTEKVHFFPPGQSAIPIHRIVAHEVRNYLNVLTEGIACLRTLPSIEAHSSLDSLKCATQQINDLIPLLQVGNAEIRKVPVDLTCLLWEQLDLLEPLFYSRTVNLIPDIPDDPIYVSGDSPQLGRAILNLIKNAIEACSEHDSVAIICHENTSHVRIIIQDSGIGMTPDQLARLWEPLFTTKPTGTGLGTCIAHQIIINHGGSIRAESTPGIGTTITIELPLLKTLSQ